MQLGGSAADRWLPACAQAPVLPVPCFWPISSLNQSTFSTVSSVSGVQVGTYSADTTEVLNVHLKPGVLTIILNILKETQDHSNENYYYY